MNRLQTLSFAAVVAVSVGCAVELAPERGPAGFAQAEWWPRARRGIEAIEYRASRPQSGEGLVAPNRAHGFRMVFRAEGVDVTPRLPADGDPGWKLAWRTTGLGRGAASGAIPATAPSAVVPRSDGSRVVYARSDFDEWYENTANGLEQGFTVHERVPGEGPLVLEGRFDGLRPELVDAAEAIDLFDARDERILRYAKLVAWDAAGTEFASRFELDGETVALVVDDAGARYPLTIDPLLTAVQWTAEPDQEGANLGVSLATAGDVNGDGYSDVIVGADRFDTGTGQVGAVFVYHGSATGLAATPAWTFEGDVVNQSLGSSVASAGDVNGDGYADVIVSALFYNNLRGRALVFHGSASGLAASSAWNLEGNQPADYLGWSVGTAGDVNGDGYADVIVGVPGFDGGQGDEGQAHVYLGSSTGLAFEPGWTYQSNSLAASFGVSVSTAGDVNGDGYADVIIGAERLSNGHSQEGRAYVFHGMPAGLTPGPQWTVEQNVSLALFGSSVSTAGDVNGDGYADVIVGSEGFTNGQTAEGRAFVYRGSSTGLAMSPSWIGESDQPNAFYGSIVATAGDVNGDGFADVLVGAERYEAGESDEGRAYLYMGSVVGTSNVANWTADGEQIEAFFASSVATAGDVNGDGFSDVLVGAKQYDAGEDDEGRAFAYHGSPFGLQFYPQWAMESNQATAQLGASLACIGDVNGDGYSDIAVCAPQYDNGQFDEGRAFLHYGSSIGPSIPPSFTLEGDQNFAFLGYYTGIAGAGDVNGDGYSDVVVGMPFYDNGNTDEGRIRVHTGAANGVLSLFFQTEPNETDAHFGYSVAGAGDVNGDGFADIIAGAEQASNGETMEGRAYVFHGSPIGMTVAWTGESNQASSRYGRSVAGAGDVNGDGYSDVIVGAERYDDDQQDEGRAYVYHGSPTGLSATPNWTVDGNQSFAELGVAVASAGDVNGDGFSDVVVASQSWDHGTGDEGKAEIYLGSASGLSMSPVWSVESNKPGGGSGIAVAGAGDVNGDGFTEVIVGYRNTAAPVSAEGTAFVYFGSASGPDTTADWNAAGGQGSAGFGHAVSSAGDTNGDGFADVIVGAVLYDNGHTNEGMAMAYLGSEIEGLERVPRQLRFDGATPIALLGRADLESAFRAAAVGRTAAGRGKVRIEVEAKPLGTPFDGTGLVTGPWTDTGTPNSLGSQFPLMHTITGLVPDSPYRWRARVGSAATHFPRTPWFSPPGNAASEMDLRSGDPVTRLLVANDASVVEGNAGTSEITFVVTVDPLPYTTITVDYATADGTATVADGDYDAVSGTFTFDPGQPTAQVSVTVHGDLEHEFDENFLFVLSNPSAAVIEDAQATGTITDDGDPSTFVVCPELDVTDRQVEKLVEKDGILYLGGAFTEVGPPTGCALPFDAATGAVLGIPRVDGVVNAVASDGAGGWYVGGDFTRVGGLARNYVAHIRPDHSPSAWNPGANGPVHALLVDGDRVFASGKFTSIGGQPRNRLAAVDAVTGVATPWNPDANGAVLALAISGATVYAGGTFTVVGGSDYRNAVAIDRTSGVPKPGWGSEIDGAVRAIAAFAERLYIGGDFGVVDGGTHAYIAALDTMSGSPTPAWTAQSGGTVRALAVGNGVLYAGGSFGTIGGQARSRLAALDLATGAATPWNPNPSSTVYAIAVNGNDVIAGGDFNGVLSQTRRFLAAFDATTGALSAWAPRPNHLVYAVAVHGSAVYAGGAFTSAGGQTRRGLAAIDLATGHVTPWNPDVTGTVLDIEVSGNVVYAAGPFLMVGGVPRSTLAAVDRTTGALLSWNPAPNGNVFDLLVDGSLVYVGGMFTNIAGTPRARLASLDVATGFASPWNPGANSPVRAIAMDGGVFYASGDFTFVGGQVRHGLAALDPSTGAATLWDPNPSGSVLTIFPHDGLIYAGGDFGAIGGEVRFGVAALDPATGEATPWHPDINGLVETLAASAGTIYAGGAFPSVGAIPHSNLAAIDQGSGAAIPWISGADSRVLSLAIVGDMIYAGGLFESFGGTMHSHLACVGPVQSTVDAAPIALVTGPNLHLSPNPSAGGPTRIEFELPRAGRVRVGVFDVRGRLVARPIDADRPAGRQAVAWNGEGKGGRVSPGIYFVRIEAFDRVETSRLVRLR